jgi:ABC-type transporter Mla MlaB component
VKADAAALDALARLALRLRRCGYQLKLRDASGELLDLIELAGLSEVLAAER